MPTPPPTYVELSTGDTDFPTVKGYIKSQGYEKGITPEDRAWRQITYQVFDREDHDYPTAGHQADLFIDALKGFTQTGLITSWNLSKYVAPHRYPLNRILWCVDARATHAGVAAPADRLHETNYVVIQARYDRIPYAIGTGTDPDVDGNYGNSIIGTAGEGGLGTVLPYVTVRTSRGTKTYKIDVSSLKSSDDADSVLPRQGFPYNIGLITYHLTYHRVPWIGQDFNTSLTGTTNLNSIWGFPAGTLKFEGAEAEPTGIGKGLFGYDVTADVTWNPVGWNKTIPAGKVNGETVTFIDDDTVFPYTPVDYSILELTTEAGP
jgi:hypothetical protein